jgi:hypothetical protein
MSVNIEPPMIEAGLPPTHYAFLDGKGVARVTAGKARALGMRVGPEPILPGNPHHGGVWEPNPQVSNTELGRRRRELSRSADVVALPPGGVTQR